MKFEPKIRAITRFLSLSVALAAAGMTVPAPVLAAGVELATVPMATSTTTTVKPNLMFVLDDSGSMDWDYLPDTAKNFAGKYGYNAAQCNGNYYNPTVTYSPPVNDTGAPLNATATTFTAAYKDGFATGAGTTNLSTGFTGGSGSGASGIALTPGPAFYYTYSGTQTTNALKNYFNTSSTFYQECNSNVGSTPGSGVFTKVRLAAVPTTTITVNAGAAAAPASITVTSAGTRSNPASVSQVRVTYGGNTYNILKATTSTTRTTSTLAGYIAAGINACTSSNSGNCNSPTAGYSAVNTSGSNVVTITGPAAAAGAVLSITFATGSSPSATLVNFPPVAANNDVTSVTVSGTQLLNATASANTPTALATAINTQINARTATSGFSSTVSSNVVTITGPVSASNVLPALAISGAGPLTLTTEAFPDSDPAKLQNFANWYSYYSNRMIMMKTGAGLAFQNVTDKYRVGFLTMNNNVSPGIVEANTFSGAQRTSWYSKLYAANPGNSTPLREALSKVGQYYAHKFGTITTYKSTITVGGSGDTSVSSVTVNGIELMDDSTVVASTTSSLAKLIADQINAPAVTDFGASASGNVITITGPATANGFTPVVTDDSGGMTYTRTAFSGTTTTATLNGITPADPVQYSCQQNFTILSTDGYWNGATTYNLTGGTVGQVDGFAARPYNDGAQDSDTLTISYSRNSYSSVACSPSVTGWRRVQTQPQVGSCNVSIASGGSPTGSESCTPSNWTNDSANPATFGSCVNQNPATLPAVNPSTAVKTGTVLTQGVSGGTADTLSDVAMYYYQTDLRNPLLGNCTGALGTSVCQDNVFKSANDNNLQQHMTTFTLGLGVRGQMVYSPSYLTDASGDFVSVKLGVTANAAPSTLVVGGTGSTTVSSIKVNGVELMSGTSTAGADTATTAANVKAKITQNGFSATVSGSTITIFGPSSGAGFSPVVTKSGSMTFTASTGTPACTWQTNGTVCNWPVPVSGQPTTVDDLWHAAVNGRGAYFSATDPESLALGLANALTSINSKVGAAAAAATSTLNPVAGNNFAYVASYTTLTWTGNLEARGINTDTGVVTQNATWCVETVPASSCASPATVQVDASGDVNAYFCVTPNVVICPGGDLVGTDCKVPVSTACTGKLQGQVGNSSDSRAIYTAARNSVVSGTSVADGSQLVPFDTAYRAANSSFFNSTLLAGLTQWPVATDLSAEAVAMRGQAPGDNLLNFLRGQRGHEIGRSGGDGTIEFYRGREAILGDALESQPAFIGAPVFSYPYPGYPEFVIAQGSRLGNVYMGTNDGMMHAFDAIGTAAGGAERWAYIPSMVVPNLWKLADSQYKDKHTNYVNGSPITTDICTARCSNAYVAGNPSLSPVWKTILVAGLNGGGRGYFALDITNPTTPTLLWEFAPSAASGAATITDADLGYTFGQPVVTRKADGTWVVLVTSGYDNGTDSPTKVSGSFVANSPAGSGQGYLYVLNAATGAIISKISTGVGTAANPSGLAKIAGYNAESGGNKVSYVYGGDLLGNLWRFDINASTAANLGTGNIGNGSALKFATLFSDTAATLPQPIMTTPILGTILGKRVIFIGTGKYLEVPDLSTTQKQTQYAIKDDDATATFVNPRTSMVQQFLLNNPDGTATRLSTNSAAATTAGSNAVDFSSGRGWFVDFPESRERVNIDAKLVLGTLVVPTIVPSSTECSPGGSGWLNFFDYLTGGPVNATPGISGVKYDSTIVGINVLFIAGNPVVEVVTSTQPTPEKDPNVQFKATSAGFAGKRVLWRELVPQD